MTSRRHFLRSLGLATTGAAFLPAYLRAAAPVKYDRVRVGVIGCAPRNTCANAPSATTWT